MTKLHTSLDIDKRSITVSYKIENKEMDNFLIKSILNLVIENKLSCTLGEDDYNTRFLHISGKNSNIVASTFDGIEKLK